MEQDWTGHEPIYKQLRDRVVAMVLDGVFQEGDPLPSVRTVAVDYRVNPITVLKAYQKMVDEGLVEKRRGLGMYVRQGAHEELLKAERSRFLADEWPKVREKIQRLGLAPEDLLGAGTRKRAAQRSMGKR